MRDVMQWVHDRTVDGMNAGTDVHTLMREVTVPGPVRRRRGLREDQLERAGHLGELRGLVPPPLHDRALRRAAGRGRARSGGRRRVERSGRRRPRRDSTPAKPVAALHLTDIVLAAEPDHAEARAVAAAATRALLDASSNFWERAWLTRSLEQLEGT